MIEKIIEEIVNLYKRNEEIIYTPHSTGTLRIIHSEENFKVFVGQKERKVIIGYSIGEKSEIVIPFFEPNKDELKSSVKIAVEKNLKITN